MFRVILVQMPFADINRPSIGLSLLKAGLEREGLACEIIYLNLRFAQFIGVERYVQIDRFAGSPQLGEWIFARELFGDRIPSTQSYYENVLRPAMREPFGTDEEAFRHTVQDSELVPGLDRLRAAAGSFLQECFRANEWSNYDLVGFTTTFQQNTPALALARLVKTAHPQLLIAFGGANCEGEMGVTLHRLFPFVDIVCSGEGDQAFVQFASARAKGAPPEPVNGIIQRWNRQTVVPTELTNPVQKMDLLPIPDYTDYLAQRAALKCAKGEITLSIESSRGCWWGTKAHCTFCGLNGSTMGFRTKSAPRFLQELQLQVTRHDIRAFSATDNIIDMRYFESVLPQLAANGPRVKLFYETKANLQRTHVQTLRESGVTQIQPGIESLSTPILQLMHKGVHAYQNIRLLRLCGEYLVQPCWNILGGFPGEDPSEYTRQADIIPSLHHLTPPVWVGGVRLDRFSPLHDQSEKFGLMRIRPSSAYKYVYPFDDSDMKRLGYFFDFDYPDGRDPLAYMRELRDATIRWQQTQALDSLIYLDDGQTLKIADKRPSSKIPFHTLKGVQRFIYLSCEEGVSPAGLRRLLAGAYPEQTADFEMKATLDEFLAAKLVIDLDGCYLSLAVGGNYRLEQLVLHLIAKTEPPNDVQQAICRLFDYHTESFSHYLINCLAANRYVEA